MAVDGADHVEFLGEGVERGHRSMRAGTELKGFAGLQSCQELIGLSKVCDDDGSGFAVDAAGLDDAPVGVAMDADAL